MGDAVELTTAAWVSWGKGERLNGACYEISLADFGAVGSARLIFEERNEEAAEAARQQVEADAPLIDANMHDAMVRSVAAMARFPLRRGCTWAGHAGRCKTCALT